MMNGCEKCIVYELHHNLVEAEECPGCGKKTLIWKQSEFGTPYMECTECAYTIGVDLNTPCEHDPVFSKKVLIVIEPQSELPAKDIIVTMANDLEMNALQMRTKLIEGFSIEMSREKLETVIRFLRDNKISYKVESYEDLRKKYPFYSECRYPYSHMQFYLRNDK